MFEIDMLIFIPLFLDYLDAQTAWEMERESLVNKAITTKDQIELETVTRKLVHITAAQQNKLSMKYADSVVRGYSHVVREALGQLGKEITSSTRLPSKYRLIYTPPRRFYICRNIARC